MKSPRAFPWSVVAWCAFSFLSAAFSARGAGSDPVPRPPGIVVAHSAASTRQYLGSPSVAILPEGTLLVSHDFFGPGSTADVVEVYGSTDRGATWSKRARIQGGFWSSLFVHRGATYLIGTSRQEGHVVIRRSTDGGRTWTEPRDGATGLLLGDVKYHCAPVPVVEHGGRVWRAFEDIMGPGRWGSYFNAFVLSAPADADLLVATNWTASRRLGRDPAWLGGKFGGWLEGNVVEAPDGSLVICCGPIIGFREEKAAMIGIGRDGNSLSFDPQRGFVEFPGGCKKFTVRRDPRDGSYWGLSNYIPPDEKAENVERTRNTLALIHSTDLHRWEVRRVLLHHPDAVNHAFQYPDWQFDGDDLVAAVRTAFDDAEGGAHNCHDANFITFHRWPGFRAYGPEAARSKEGGPAVNGLSRSRNATFGPAVARGFPCDPKGDCVRPRWTEVRAPHATLRLVMWLLGFAVLGVAEPRTGGAEPLPNIVLIYADDLGYGDLGCYGATRVKTPNLDRLSREGLLFTDAHAPAATCTPSRYALMTGRYAWRKKGTGVLPGDAALILEPGRTTLPSMLKRAGYRTGVVGKWHLGLGPGPGKTDWNGEVTPGPLEVGFDEAFIMPATGDRVPCVYVENHRVYGLDPDDPIRVSFAGPIGDEPTGKSRPDLLRVVPSHGHDMTIVEGVSRIGYMSGGRAARWKDTEMADDFLRRASGFVAKHRENRFFLYYAPHDIHVPRVPHPRHVGRSEMGPRGDAIVQLDACVGELLSVLDRDGLAERTLVIFSSDNGPVVDDGYRDEAVTKLGGHRPAGPWRGGKYSAFEGGTRVPLLVRWPGHIAPGVSEALVSHVDLLASFAAWTGQSLAAGEAPDSENVLPALLGRSPRGRERLVEQASALALREGPWKYIEPSTGAKFQAATSTETGLDPAGQLFDLAVDPGETNNLVEARPEKVRELADALERIRAADRKEEKNP